MPFDGSQFTNRWSCKANSVIYPRRFHSRELLQVQVSLFGMGLGGDNVQEYFRACVWYGRHGWGWMQYSQNCRFSTLDANPYPSPDEEGDTALDFAPRGNAMCRNQAKEIV